jgi:hypothetical protein
MVIKVLLVVMSIYATSVFASRISEFQEQQLQTQNQQRLEMQIPEEQKSFRSAPSTGLGRNVFHDQSAAGYSLTEEVIQRNKMKAFGKKRR